MKIGEMAKVLDAKVLTKCGDLNQEVQTACGSDMMSDVLAYVKDQGVLLTGLNNPQVVRTASMMDMHCVVFVRGKVPEENILQLAEDLEIVVLATSKTMFSACGILYGCGVQGGEQANGKTAHD